MKLNFILLVDDSAATNYFHQLIIEESACTEKVLAIQSGEEALKFLESAQGARLPVFAIGGLAAEDIRDAHLHGAHGIAMLSQFGLG